ncbi:hypothetical protein GW17_00058630 [Ensete ventricosum]|nr:hypothetical protein GW17_00058630 [Ensete ventricosum]
MDWPVLIDKGLVEIDRQRTGRDSVGNKLVETDWQRTALKEEAGLVAVVAAEARASEATQRAEESQRRETEARGRIQVLETQLQGLGDELDATRAKTPEAEQSLVMTRSALEKVESSLAGRPGVLSARYPQLEIEEDPYATFSEDDNLPMEAKVSFDDSDPPAI